MINVFKNSNKPFIEIKRKNIIPVTSALSLSFLIFVLALTTNYRNGSEKHNILSDQSSKNAAQKSNINYQKSRPKYVEGQVVVRYKDDEIKLSNSDDKSKTTKLAKSTSLEKIKSVKEMNVETYKITDGKSVEEKIEELKKDDRIKYAEPNYIYYTTYTPNDTYYDQQWALENTGQSLFEGNTGTVDADTDVSNMWDIETKHESDIIVAVIDTGVALNHSDLRENLMPGYDALGGDAPYDTTGHGSHVAGIIASVVNNSKEISGISRYNNVKVLPIRAGDDDGFNLTNILASIEYAQNNGAKIINMSFGSTGYSKQLEDAIRAYPGLVVASAGNGGFDGIGDNNDTIPIYPASYDLPNIISVASTDQHDNLSTFSNYGIKSVDIGAPGENILSLSGKLAFGENFNTLVPPNIGDGYVVSGTRPNWGTINYSDNDIALITDTNAWIPSGTYAGGADSYITFPELGSDPHSPKYRQGYMSFSYTCRLPDPYGGMPKLSLETLHNGVWKTIFTEENTTPWERVTVDISNPYHPTINIRFRWQTPIVSAEGTDMTTYFGCIIDDVEFFDTGITEGGCQMMSGTSMSSPYVAAIAAMVWGKNPDISPRVVKRIVLETGDIVGDLPGKILTGRRVNAFGAYSANPKNYGWGDDPDNPDDPIDPDPIDPDPIDPRPTDKVDRVVFHPDKRCHWKKPDPIERIELKPAEKDGVKGMQLTWVQVNANKVDIKIDDGTGKYPWKISNTENDGHEFLANVASWQNITIKPINHCKKGEESVAVSFNKYPYGWHKDTTLAKVINGTAQSGSGTTTTTAQKETSLQSSTSNESTQSVPETGSEELLLIVISSILTGLGAYFIHDGRSRALALKDFEKKSANKL